MNNKDLIDIIDKIGDDMLVGSEKYKNKSNKNSLALFGKIALAVAAVAMIIFAVVMKINHIQRGEDERSVANSLESTEENNIKNDIKDTVIEGATEENTEKNTESVVSENELIILCQNDEFARGLLCYPGFDPEPSAAQIMSGAPIQGGKIGDVNIKIFYATENEVYSNIVKNYITNNNGEFPITSVGNTFYISGNEVTADHFDMVITETDNDYFIDLINSDALINVTDLPGVEESILDNQYSFTYEMARNERGEIKGLCADVWPSVLYYNRDIAESVFGTDNPEVVQEAVKDWESFYNTAVLMQSKGYYMLGSAEETYMAYEQNKTTPWVVGNQIQVDDKVKEWAEKAKALYEAGAIYSDEKDNLYDLWSGYNYASVGDTFCCIGQEWLINFCMDFDHARNDGNVAEAGKWGAVLAPESYNYGGKYWSAVKGTQYEELIGNIISFAISNEESLFTTAKDESVKRSVNNKSIISEISENDEFNSYILGGMNPWKLYDESAKRIEDSFDRNLYTKYDSLINDIFVESMEEYITGEVSYDDALLRFYDVVRSYNPDLISDLISE